MKNFSLFVMTFVLLTSCDETRVYEKNLDFENQAWMVGHKPEFDFVIDDTTVSYNVYCNVRNSLNYPFSRIFLTWYLQDSIGKVEQQKLINQTIFDPSTGKPQGTSGLGDIYDHQFQLLSGHRFPHPGTHRIKLEQFMRKDTLDGVIAVGIRVEKNLAK